MGGGWGEGGGRAGAAIRPQSAARLPRGRCEEAGVLQAGTGCGAGKAETPAQSYSAAVGAEDPSMGWAQPGGPPHACGGPRHAARASHHHAGRRRDPRFWHGRTPPTTRTDKRRGPPAGHTRTWTEGAKVVGGGASQESCSQCAHPRSLRRRGSFARLTISTHSLAHTLTFFSIAAAQAARTDRSL